MKTFITFENKYHNNDSSCPFFWKFTTKKTKKQFFRRIKIRNKLLQSAAAAVCYNQSSINVSLKL